MGNFYKLKKIILVFNKNFDHVTWLAGSQFPDQGLNPSHGSESPKSYSLGHQETS